VRARGVLAHNARSGAHMSANVKPLDSIERDEPLPLIPPFCRRCDHSDPELRHCAANNGVAWQCRSCGYIVGNWIPHSVLPGLDVAALPEWVRR
jgi:hypothetical protein